MKVIFMGTPEFAVPSLEAIHSKHHIVAVYTQPDRPVGRGLEVKFSPVKTKALALKLPVFQPEKLTLEGEFEKLAHFKPDVIVVVAYGQILRKNVLTLPRLGCINIHSSLLPRWRGAAPIQWAILAGDSVTGISTMHLVEKLDAGDILLQKETPIGPEDTANTVHDRLSAIGAELIIPTLMRLEDGSLKGKSQDEDRVTYASKLQKEMEWLDPELIAEELDRRVRALNPWPGTSLFVGQRLRIKKANPQPKIEGPKGQIFERAGMLLLGTSKGSLELTRLQWEGKKEMSVGEFLNGLKGKGQALPLKTERPSAAS